MKSKYYLNIIVLTLVSKVFFSSVSYSQEFNYDDYEIKNHRYGFGIGFNPFYIKHDFGDLNKSLISSGNEKFSSNNLLTLGGSFFTYIGFLPNLRLGGFWSTAEKESFRKSEDINREFNYDFSFWGLSCEYSYPAAKRFSIVGGIMLGRGSQEYELSTSNKNSISWDDVWNPYGSSVYEKKLSLNSSFLIYSPFIMVEYAVWDFLAVRAGGGYMGSANTDLNYEDFYPVQSAPSSLRINNFYFQFGILAGLYMD